MRSYLHVLLVFLVILFPGCAAITTSMPKSEAEKVAGYTYVPLDPFTIPVSKEVAAALAKQSDKPGEVLKHLPDNTVRVSVETFDGKGNVSFGPVTSNAAGSSHRVTTDYTVTDAVGFKVVICHLVKDGAPVKNEKGTPLVHVMTEREARIRLATMDARAKKEKKVVTNESKDNANARIDAKAAMQNEKSDAVIAMQSKPKQNSDMLSPLSQEVLTETQVEEMLPHSVRKSTAVQASAIVPMEGIDFGNEPIGLWSDIDQSETSLVDLSDVDLSKYNPADLGNVYTIPIYVGIGLRITADVRTMRGDVNISALASLGAQTEAGIVRGTLVAQTLGVNGEAISAALPIQSELNATTIQNSLVAVGSIKALLYSEKTTIRPRVVGMYIPFQADKQLVNVIISLLHEDTPTWTPFGFEDQAVLRP
jgi:hypothetical protein